MRWSEQQNFNNCPFKYKLQKEGLKKIEDGSESNDLLWGQAFHKALEAHYKGASYEESCEAFKQVYPTDLKEGELIKNQRNGLAILKGYIDFYKNQDKNWKVLATELEGEVDLGDDGDESHGLHIDLVAENLQGGGIYFWDHKTTYKQPYPSYWKKYEISSQITRYTAWTKEKFGQCSGAYINNITVGYTPPYEPKKTSNTYLESLKNPQSFYEHSKVGFSKYHKKDMTVVHGATAKFERQLFNRTDDQIEFWKKSDQDWMKMIAFCEENNVWPKSLDTLCGWCEFYELRISNDNEQIRDAMYGKEMGELKVDV